METTLGKIKIFNPCTESMEKISTICRIHGITDDTPLTPMDILAGAGIQDAVWALRAFDYKDYCLFLADIAESVYHLSGDRRVWDCIQAIHYYHHGFITHEQLRNIAADAADAADAEDAADAADAADVAAAYSAAYAAYAATAVAVYAAAHAVHAVHASAYAAAAVAIRATKEEKWKEIEQLYIKHFDI